MKKLLFACVLLVSPVVAQNAIYVFPPAPRTPVGGIQSIAAVVTGNANKKVNWSSNCGKLIGDGNTIGLKNLMVGTCKVTATMAADPTKTASSEVTFEVVRKDLQAAGVHPRIGLTPSDVEDLRTKTVAKNLVWSQGLLVYFAGRQAYYDAKFCWTGKNCGPAGPIGTLNPEGWIDTSTSFAANGGGMFDSDAWLYASMSLIDPTEGNRAKWAAHARDMAMWEMNEICYNAYTGSGPCVARNYDNRFMPFIGSQFVMNNRSQTCTLTLIQTLDRIYSSLSAADKATIAKVGHLWGKQLTGANEYDITSGTNEHVIPIGAYNDVSIISGNAGEEEGGSNNFSLGHWQALTAIGLLLDPADDPPQPSCATTRTSICASDGSAQTVGAYAVYAVKGWLYRLYANFEDQHIVDYAYRLNDPFLCPDMNKNGSIPCTGSMSGGFVSEGTGYGGLSMSIMFPTLYALYTSGKLNPATDPQASFISSAYWDKLAVSWVHQLYPNVSGNDGGRYTQFGSDQDYAVGATEGVVFNDMEVYDAKYGSPWRKGIDKWYQYNILYGGVPDFFGRFLGVDPVGGGNIGGAQFPIFTMEATPVTSDGDFSRNPPHSPAQNAYDPRNTATLPVEFENLSSKGGFYRYYGRNNWSTTATQFQFGCNTSWQDHGMPSCGRIDFLRKGEPLTTALGGTSNNDLSAQAPQHQNIPGYQWNPSFDCNNASADVEICIEGGMADSAWGNGANVVLARSSSTGYYYAATDASNAYEATFNDNRWGRASANVTLSQREVVWLKPDQIFIYDRANTKSASSFKNFYLDLETSPAISGNQAVMTSTNGQKLFISVLLPTNPELSASTLDRKHQPNSPVTTLLTSKGGSASVTRMLHVLEGKDSGTASKAVLVQSSTGTKFDGGAVGNSIVMFKRTLTDAFTSTTYAVSGATRDYVTGLTPDATYTISAAGAPSSGVADSGGVLIFSSAGTGNVSISASNR